MDNATCMQQRFSKSCSSRNHIDRFCNKENFCHCINFLDQELSVLGYPSICSNDELDQVSLVNVARDLLVIYKDSLESCSEIHDQLRNSESGTTRLQHLLSLTKEDLASKDRELQSKFLEEKHLNQRIEVLKKKLKTELERSRRLSTELLSRDTQFKHEKKKKLQEIEKMQSKIHQLLQDKRQDRLLGIEILNSLQRSDGSRAKWSTDKTKRSNEHDMYRIIISNYEESQKQLLKENNDMRKYLKQMQEELITALNEKLPHTGSDGEISCASKALSPTLTEIDKSDLCDGVFEMPYDLVKEDIEKSLNSKWKALKEEIHKEKENNNEKSQENGKVMELKGVVKEQQRLIDYFTSLQESKGEISIPKDSYFLEEKADLEKQRNSFKQQRIAFERERKSYTDALLQLGEDRQTFEEEKRHWLQQNFMQITPFRAPQKPNTFDSQDINSPFTSNGSREADSDDSSYCDVTESTVAGSIMMRQRSSTNSGESKSFIVTSFESPSNSATSLPPTPSTKDLYKVLGLQYNGKENLLESNTRSLSKERIFKRPSNDAVAPSSVRKRSGRYKVDDIKISLFQDEL